VLISLQVKKIISQQVCILQETQCAYTLLSSLRGAVQINSSALPSRTSVRKSPAPTAPQHRPLIYCNEAFFSEVPAVAPAWPDSTTATMDATKRDPTQPLDPNG